MQYTFICPIIRTFAYPKRTPFRQVRITNSQLVLIYEPLPPFLFIPVTNFKRERTSLENLMCFANSKILFIKTNFLVTFRKNRQFLSFRISFKICHSKLISKEIKKSELIGPMAMILAMALKFNSF